MTYWALNAIFLGVVVVVVALAVVRRRAPSWPAVALTMAVLLVMTAVFDNVMIGVGLVAYAPELISGAFIGIAPLEDFAYTIAAVLGLPALWSLLARSRSHDIALPEATEDRSDADDEQ
jgi:lycopene cyclase domain-containing protein